MKASIQLVAAGTPAAFEITRESVRWVGRLDDEPEAPLVAWELTELDEPTWRAFADPDPDALGPIVAARPMPVPLLAALATRCLAVAADASTSRALREEQALAIARGDVDADPRWTRALATAALARDVPARATIDATVETIVQPDAQGFVAHPRVLPDGTVVALQTRGTCALHFVKGTHRRRIALGADPQVQFTMLEPLATDPSLVAVVAIRIEEGRGAVSSQLAIFDATGARVGRAAGLVAGWPYRFSLCDRGVWLHTADRHALLALLPAGDDFLPPREPPPSLVEHASSRWGNDWPCSVGRWILAMDSHNSPSGQVATGMAWIALDTAEVHPFAWSTEVVRRLVDAGDALWCTRPDGLWRLSPGEAPHRVWSGEVWGVAVDGDRAWLTTTAKPQLFEIDLATGTEHWRTDLPHAAYEVHRARGGSLVAAGSFRLTIVDGSGRVIAAPDERRDTAFVELADGTAAASCGEVVIVLGTDGTLHRCAPLPYDGKLLGATSDRFLFGPDAYTQSYDAIDALYAIDALGRLTSRLPFGDRMSQSYLHPSLVEYFAGVVYLVDAAGALVRWDPHGPAIESSAIPAPPPREPTHRDQTRAAPDVINPRDDRPEVGLEIRRTSFFAIAGTYSGSGGQMSEVPVRITDGAIATFVDCDLRKGGGGDVVERASTLFLVRCKLPGAHTSWNLGKDCHLVVIDCEIANTWKGTLNVYGAGSLVVHGNAASRESSYTSIR